MPSRYLKVTLVMAAQGSGKGSLHSSQSLGTCLAPSVPPLAWVHIVLWVHGVPRVTEHGTDSCLRALASPTPVSWSLPRPSCPLPASGNPASRPSAQVPPRVAEILPEVQQPTAGPDLALALVTMGPSPLGSPAFPESSCPTSCVVITPAARTWSRWPLLSS